MSGGTVLRHWFLACLSLSALTAAEHHGQVAFGGLPLPGATVTAIQGGRNFTAVTDQQGLYSFPDLPDGVWTIRVEMLLSRQSSGTSRSRLVRRGPNGK
jgi:uncharacterized GH25 family protein